MPNFILNRNATLAAKGHMIVLRKGQPTWVPPEIARDAIAIGADLVDGDKDALMADEVVAEPESLTAVDKELLFFKAFDTVVVTNNREDFGGDGKPTLAAIKALVPFAFSKKELVLAYQAYRNRAIED